MMGMCSGKVGTKPLNLGFAHPFLFSWGNVALQEARTGRQVQLNRRQVQLSALVRGWRRHHSCAGGKQCRSKLDLLLQVLGCFLFVAFPVTHWCNWKWGSCTDFHQLKLWPVPTISFFCFSKVVGSDLESTDHSCQEELLNAVEIH